MASIKSPSLWILALLVALPFRWQANCPNGYAGFLPPRLAVGQTARVIPGGVPNRLRDQPNLNGAQVGMAAPESTLAIIGGPVCDAEGQVIWWQVQMGNVTGWTAEGFAPDEYFLEPVGEAGAVRGATAIARATVSSAETDSVLATAASLNATSTEQARLGSIQTQAVLTQTAQALITPSETAKPTATLTITPTLAPLTALPENRTMITSENIEQLTTMVSLPYAATILFLPDQSQMLVNGADAYDLPSMERTDHFGNFPLQDREVAAINPDGRYVVYYSDRQVISVFDTQTEEAFELSDPTGFAGTDLVISGGPEYRLAIAYGEGYANQELPQIYLYDLATNTLAFTLDNNASFGAQLAFNRDGSRLATTGAEIRLINTHDARWIIPTSGFSSGDIAYRPVADNESEQIAFGVPGGVYLFDLGRGTGRTFEITGGSTGGRIGFSPDGRLLAVVGIEVEGDFDVPSPRFNLFDVETGELLIDTGEYDGAFTFSPDGTLLVVSSMNGATRILGVPA
jgi:WD40 repeat protein